MTTIIAKYHHWLPIARKRSGSKSTHVPADLAVVVLWATLGLVIAALSGAFDAGADLAGILAVAE